MKAKFSKKNEWFLPSWLFLVVMTVVYELFLHLGSMDSFLFSRFAVVLVFAVGFACLLGLIASCFPQKAQKWLVVGITFLLAVLYIVQYFVHDAYQVFMTFGSILNGAEGVATNYLNVVVSLLTRSLWKIILLLLPIILFSRLTTPSRCSWKTRIALLCVTLVMYGAGYGIIQIAKVDKAKFSLSCSFDNAVESFGLNMGLGINAQILQFFRRMLGIAAANRQHCIGLLPAHPPDHRPVLLIRYRGDGTGVDNIGIARVFQRAHTDAFFMENLLHSLGFILIYLAAQGVKAYFHCEYHQISC